ncbi:MAG: flagellin [Clostridiales bacterium]|jgi:flagellin|nr:flagellin [Clostridiales bacterium]
MKIVDNIAALRVHTQLTRTNNNIATNTMRLSSGFRINSAADDPAGMAISLHMRRQIDAMNMADRNVLDGTSMLETADAAMQDVHNMLQRIRELAVQAANDTNTERDRTNIQYEVDALIAELEDITRKVEFNNIRLLNGEVHNLRVQAGGRQNQSIDVTLPPIRPWDMGLANHPDPLHPNHHTDWQDAITAWNAQPGLDPLLLINVAGLTPEELNSLHITSPGLANLAIQELDRAIDQVSRHRAHIGGFLNRFEYTSSGLQSAVLATSQSLSRVMDTDMAYEMMRLSTNNVLNQAGMAIMAQANARPQQLLQLIN